MIPAWGLLSKKQWVGRKSLLLHLPFVPGEITLNIRWASHLHLIRHSTTVPRISTLFIVKQANYFKSSFELIFLNQPLDGFNLFLTKTLNWIWYYSHFACSTYLVVAGRISGCFYLSRICVYQMWGRAGIPQLWGRLCFVGWVGEGLGEHVWL